MKKNKNLIIVLIILFIISWIALFVLNHEKENNIIWKVISDKKWDQSIIDNSNSWDINSPEKIKQIEELNNRIRSQIRILCSIWTIDQIVWTNSFKVIKWNIDKIKKEYNNDSDFQYVILPWIIYSTCANADSTFLEKITKYLQSESLDLITNDSFEINKYKDYLETIEFDNDNIDKLKIKQDKEYLDKVLFEKNLEAIQWSYFSEYMYRNDSAERFFSSNSMLSLSETNEILEETVWDFEGFVKKLWINDINELRTLLLKNNNVDSVKGLTYIIKDDLEILEETLSNKDIDIVEKLSTTQNTLNFYNDEYIELIKDDEIKNLFTKIWKWYLLFSIINDDYADWLDEDWSWKEFFWDSIKWNTIIKIWYIYLFDSNKK